MQQSEEESEDTWLGTPVFQGRRAASLGYSAALLGGGRMRTWGRSGLGLFIGLLLASCSTRPAGLAPVRLESLDYTLAPGEERYLCYTMTLPLGHETTAVAYRPEYGQGTHHIFFGYTLSPEPDGFSECNVLQRNTWIPLFVGGQGTTDLELPPGAANRLVPGTQLLLQLHVLNASSSPITARTAVEMELVEPVDSLVPAGIFGFDDRRVAIPPHATRATQVLTCTPGHHMEVFAVLGHMHQYGQHVEIFRGMPDTGEVLFDELFSFRDQPTIPMHFVVEPTDTISIRCTYDNPLDTPIVYGESSLNEMCVGVFYYTPGDVLDGCIGSTTP